MAEDFQIDKNKLALNPKIVGGGLAAAAAGAMVLGQCESAQAADPLADITTAVDTIVTIKDAAIPLGVAVLVFGVASMVVKKMVYH
jgi:hypothetical protein